MSQIRYNERGEGKVGCIISAVILGILVAIAIKVVPVFYGNNQMVDAAERKAESASGRSEELILRELLEDAKTIGVLDALKARAVTVTKRGGGEGMGNCTVTLNYKTVVDLWGVYKWEIIVDKRISKPLLENVR